MLASKRLVQLGRDATLTLCLTGTAKSPGVDVYFEWDGQRFPVLGLGMGVLTKLAESAGALVCKAVECGAKLPRADEIPNHHCARE